MFIALPPYWQAVWPALLLAVPWLLCAIYLAPWRALLESQERLHLAAFSMLGLALFWQVQVRIDGLLGFHPFLMAALVLVFGWSLSQCFGLLALLFYRLCEWALIAAGEGASWQGLAWLPVDYLFNVLVPTSFIFGFLTAVQRLPRLNLFAYTLGVGFVGAMLSVHIVALSIWCYFTLFDLDVLLVLFEQHYIVLALMMFIEGFINGAVVTVMTVFKPHWVKTYDDERYLGKR